MGEIRSPTFDPGLEVAPLTEEGLPRGWWDAMGSTWIKISDLSGTSIRAVEKYRAKLCWDGASHILYRSKRQSTQEVILGLYSELKKDYRILVAIRTEMARRGLHVATTSITESTG